MSSSKVIASNTKEIVNKFEEVAQIWGSVSKSIEEISVVLKGYADRDNVPLYREIAGALDSVCENVVGDIKKLVNDAQETSLEAHKEMAKLTESLNF